MNLMKFSSSSMLRTCQMATNLLRSSAHPAVKQSVSNLQTSARLSNLLCKNGLSSANLMNISRPASANAKASSAAMSVESQTSATFSRPCTVHDREEMIDFMSRLFVTREPLMKACGATPENSRMYVEYCIDEALLQNASFLSVDEGTGKICGLRLNAIGPSSGDELHHDFGREVNAVPKFLHYMESDMPEVLKTDRYMRHVAICVEPSVVQCGIATDLMKLSVNLAKEEGLFGMTAMCSWKLPYKLAAKMGYKRVREVFYDSYAKLLINDQQAQVFMKLASTEGAARLMVKELR